MSVWNRSVKNVVRWLENSKRGSGLVLEAFNWGVLAERLVGWDSLYTRWWEVSPEDKLHHEWLPLDPRLSLSVKSLKLGVLNLDCNCLLLKRRKVTWPTTDPEAWSQYHAKLWENSNLPCVLGRNENMGVRREIVKWDSHKQGWKGRCQA